MPASYPSAFEVIKALSFRSKVIELLRCHAQARSDPVAWDISCDAFDTRFREGVEALLKKEEPRDQEDDLSARPPKPAEPRATPPRVSDLSAFEAGLADLAWTYAEARAEAAQFWDISPDTFDTRFREEVEAILDEEEPGDLEDDLSAWQPNPAELEATPPRGGTLDDALWANITMPAEGEVKRLGIAQQDGQLRVHVRVDESPFEPLSPVAVESGDDVNIFATGGLLFLSVGASEIPLRAAGGLAQVAPLFAFEYAYTQQVSAGVNVGGVFSQLLSWHPPQVDLPRRESTSDPKPGPSDDGAGAQPEPDVPEWLAESDDPLYGRGT